MPPDLFEAVLPSLVSQLAEKEEQEDLGPSRQEESRQRWETSSGFKAESPKWQLWSSFPDSGHAKPDSMWGLAEKKGGVK